MSSLIVAGKSSQERLLDLFVFCALLKLLQFELYLQRQKRERIPHQERRSGPKINGIDFPHPVFETKSLLPRAQEVFRFQAKTGSPMVDRALRRSMLIMFRLRRHVFCIERRSARSTWRLPRVRMGNRSPIGAARIKNSGACRRKFQW